MKEKFLGGWGGGTVAGEEPRPSSGRTAGPPPLAAHLPGPLSAALAAQPRRLPGEQALLTDSVLLLFLFYSHPGQSLETRSGTFIRMSCCLPKTSVSGAQAAGRRNPDIRRRQPERVAQRSKTPGAARGDWWEGVASQAEVAESEIRRPRSVVPFPQPRGKMGNQKNSVNPKCEKIQKPRLLAP